MIEPQSNSLTRRIVRFTNYNLKRYIDHRSRGEYTAAVERLRRVDKLIALIKQADEQGKCELSWDDWLTLRSARRHVGAMTGRPVPDIYAIPLYPQPALI